MESHSMDHSAAESLLSGMTSPEEAPDIRRVRALLGAAARPVPAAFSSRDDRTIARMLDVIGDAERTPATAKSTRSRRILGLLSMLRAFHAPRRRLLKTKLVGGLAVMTFIAGTGLAFAGALPGGMQDTASHLLRRVGIHVPEQEAPLGRRPVGGLGVDARAPGGSAIHRPIPRVLSTTGNEKRGRAPSESGDQSDQGSGSGSGEHGDGSGSSGGGGDQSGSGSGGDSGGSSGNSNSGDGRG